MFGSMDLVMINDSELAGLKPFSQIAKGFGGMNGYIEDPTNLWS